MFVSFDSICFSDLVYIVLYIIEYCRWASDAVWSPDGKYVYAAARLHDTISVFKLNYEIDGYRQLASPQECLDSIVIENLGAYRLI